MVNKRLDLRGELLRLELLRLELLGLELLGLELLSLCRGRECSGLLLRSHWGSWSCGRGSQSLLESELTGDLGDLLQAGDGGRGGLGSNWDGGGEVEPLEDSEDRLRGGGWSWSGLEPLCLGGREGGGEGGGGDLLSRSGRHHTASSPGPAVLPGWEGPEPVGAGRPGFVLLTSSRAASQVNSDPSPVASLSAPGVDWHILLPVVLVHLPDGGLGILRQILLRLLSLLGRLGFLGVVCGGEKSFQSWRCLGEKEDSGGGALSSVCLSLSADNSSGRGKSRPHRISSRNSSLSHFLLLRFACGGAGPLEANSRNLKPKSLTCSPQQYNLFPPAHLMI